MAEIFGIKRLKTIQDWIEVVSARHWVVGKSAWELSQKWRDVGASFPEPISSILSNCAISLLRSLEIKQVYAEFPVWLDTHSTPSKNDLMIFCENTASRKITIAVEAKCDESFANKVCEWIRAMDKPMPRGQRKLFNLSGEPVPRKLRRLAFLNEVLSLNIEIDSPVRYQLLHRLTSAILIARQTFADATVMLVQAFSDSPRNFEDFQYFCGLLGFENVAKDTVIGPYKTAVLPDTPVYLIYVQDRRQGDLPHDSLFPNHSTKQAA